MDVICSVPSLLKKLLNLSTSVLEILGIIESYFTITLKVHSYFFFLQQKLFLEKINFSLALSKSVHPATMDNSIIFLNVK